MVTSVSDARYRTLARLLPGCTDSVRLFGDVVGESITKAGGRKLILAQAGHVAAAVEGACADLPEDSVYRAASVFPGTHRRISSTLSELRDWGFDADAMLSATENLEAELANKMRSLAFIERGVSDSLRSIARERNPDRITTALCLEGGRTDMGRLLVLVGSELAANQAEWLCWAVEAGVSLTLVLERGSQDSLDKVEALLRKLGAKSEELGTPNRLQANLFGGHEKVKNPAEDIEVQIVSSAEPLAECEWILRAVARELDSGAEPGDLCIFCRDQEGYVPLLEASALRFGIPISCSRHLPLMSNSFARLTLDVLEFCAGDDVRALGKVLRSTYLGLDADARSMADEAVKSAFAGREDQWKILDAWASEHEEQFPWLSSLLRWRTSHLKAPAPLTTWCERLLEFGQQPWHAEAVDGKADTSLRDSYAQTSMQRSLAQYASVERVQTKRTYSLRDFVRACKRIWESAEVSTPSKTEAVQVVSNSAAIWDVQSLYVLGLIEGVFPRRRSEDPILTDADRAALSQIFPDKPPLRDSHDKAAAERDEFCRLCGAASKKLVLSYPQTEDERDNVRAFYLVEVERAMAGDLTHIDHPRTDLTENPASIMADHRLGLALQADRADPLPNELITEEARAAVSEAAKRHLTPSDLSEVLDCPFRYLAQRNLQLAPNRRRSRWYRLFRLPRETGLASLPFRESAQRALELALEAELERLVSLGTPHDLALMRAGGERLIEEWLEREFSARELWPRETLVDKPSFENGQLRSKLRAGDSFVHLKGDFPALSERNGYRILHLFSASDPFDETADSRAEIWDKLKESQQFELGLYLSALGSGPGDRVGIEIDKASGGRILFVSPRPDESLRADQLHDFKVCAIDHELRAHIRKTVFEKVGKAASRIQQAIVEPTPDKICRTCDYGEMCRRSTEFGEEEDPFEVD